MISIESSTSCNFAKSLRPNLKLLAATRPIRRSNDKTTNVFKCHTCKLLGDLEDVRTLRNNNEYLVKAIYHFFRSVCSSPSFTLSDWFMLYHSGSMDDLKS